LDWQGYTGGACLERIRRNTKLAWIIICVIIFIVFIVIGLMLLRKPKSTTVTLTTVAAHTLQNTLFETGTVKPVDRQIIYSSQLAGQAQDFKVSIGDHVKKGQTLFSVLGPDGTYSVNATVAGEVIIENQSGVAADGTPAPVVEIVGARKQVIVNVSEMDAVQIHKSLTATLSSDAFPGKTYSAEVSRVADYALQDTSGAGQVEVDLNPKGTFPIPIGYQVDIHIVSSPHRTATAIPYNALVQNGDKYDVFRYQDGKVTSVPVTLGNTTDNFVEVTKGLQSGDKIVTNPNPGLQNGEAVSIT
jgi:multidrug efflux pump subunit AcrA (membrane-fusion protein)